MGRLLANLKLLWRCRDELTKAYARLLRPLAVAFAWHFGWVALLGLILGFEHACLAWIVSNLASRDAAVMGYGAIKPNQY